MSARNLVLCFKSIVVVDLWSVGVGAEIFIERGKFRHAGSSKVVDVEIQARGSGAQPYESDKKQSQSAMYYRHWHTPVSATIDVWKTKTIIYHDSVHFHSHNRVES